MRSVDRQDLDDLATLAKGVETIMGGNPLDGSLITTHLFVWFGEDFKLPVYSDRVDGIIGHFQWNDSKEDVVFVPVKS